MTEIIFTTVFLICVGYVIGKLFKGLNPFKLIFGLIFGSYVSAYLLDINNDLYTGLFILGVFLNFGNPFSRFFSVFEDFKVHRMYQKSLQSQKASIENELNKKVDTTSRYYQQKEEEIRRQEEELRRKQAEFKRNNSQSSAKKTVQESIAEAMKILGLKPGFTAHELKKAYKRESMKYHPDRGGNNPEHIKKLMELKFKEVVSAFRYLEGVVK
ncbi:MAG: DnaJ domain-containing protein [Colwellia sp.]